MSRLSDLKFNVNELLKENFDLAQLPATSRLRNYYEWSTDPQKRELSEESQTASGKKMPVALTAFGIKTAAEAKVIVKIGKRARDFWNGLASKAKFGLSETLTDHNAMPGFVPHKAHLAQKLANAASLRSKITGKRYTPKTKGSWVVPVGVNGANTNAIDAENAIVGDAAITDVYTVSFTPERLRRGA